MKSLGKIFSWQKKLDAGFKTRFHKLGVYIGERPGYFLLIPLLISFLLGTGLQQIKYENDPGYIFTPRNGKASQERVKAEDLFPVDYSAGFNPSRFHRPGRYARLIITAQDGGTLFRQKIWDEMQRVENLIHSIKIIHDELEYSFEQLCARWGNDCYGNEILELTSKMTEIETGSIILTHPMSIVDNKMYVLPMFFGGLEVIQVNESVAICKSAKAVQLNYFLDADSPKRDDRGGIWEKEILDQLEKAEDSGKWKWIKVERFTERSLPDQINTNVLSTLPYAAVAAPLMVGFALFSCMMGWDWVRSKPWLGIVGVVTPTLGTLASFGLLCYCGIPMIGLNVAAPFLMMGIGMDDAYVILSAWRQTSVHDPVSKRMGEAYAEAAVSITITSITDFLSFVIGISSSFVSIQIFSAYTATAVFFTYVLHIFFFGGALALAGYHEAENRHCLLWWKKAIPKSKFLDKSEPKRSSLTRFFFRGGNDPDDPLNPINVQQHGVMIFFRDTWASLLLNRYVKIFILLLFALYLGIAGWGVSKIEGTFKLKTDQRAQIFQFEGMELKRIATGGGYVERFYSDDDQYFQDFPFRIQAIIDSPDLYYSDKTVQTQIEKLITELNSTKYTEGGFIYSEYWLPSFLEYSKNLNLTINTEIEFIENLLQFFSIPEASVFSLDVKFNSVKTRITASRFIVQTVNLKDWKDRRDMLTTLRSVAQDQSPDLDVTVFNPLFLFVDQFLLIRTSTIQLVGIAAGVMLIVSLIFIPNPLCFIWVALAVISIEIGVLGFLALWNVNLDVLSMIYLVMSVGFSVDFSAHISYAYISNVKAISEEERLRACLHSLGLPIVQGALSTILGVLPLVISPAYDFVTFFKAVFLVMIIATAHGLLLLPVLLTIFHKKNQKPNLNRKKLDGINNNNNNSD